MKIGILTFHYSNHNFGAVLQTYASYRLLENAGHSPQIINLLPAHSKEPFYKLKSFFLDFLNSSNNFSKFLHKHVEMTNPVYTFEECNELNSIFDAFYVGSDQVWRTSMAKNNHFRYFLDFADDDKLKMSYAASFGTGEWYEATDTEKKKMLLKRFDAISVREKSGVIICDNIFGVEAAHVLDPTLLFDAVSYEYLIDTKTNPQNNKEKYFAYYLLSDKRGDGYLPIKFTKELNMNAKNIYLKNKSRFFKRVYSYNTVGRWIQEIKDSEYVITDSFHCVIFSIIFKKNFICLVNEQKGADRIENLLNQLGLEKRLCRNLDFESHNHMMNIDYEKVYNKLNILRKISFDYIYSTLISIK